MSRQFASVMVALFLAILLGSLTACKQKTDQAPGTAPGAAETIKIGAIFAVTGPASWLGAPEKNTAEMLVEQINAKGGINGHKLELIVIDSRGDAEQTVAAAKKLISEHQVYAIIGPSTSGTTMAIKNLCEENQTILISCAAAEAIVVPTAKYVFKTPQKDSFAAEAIFKKMKAMGLTKAAVLHANDGFGQGGRAQLEKYAPLYGIELVLVEQYDAKATDLSDVVSKVKDRAPEAVINWSVTEAQGTIAKTLRQKGLDVPLFQSHGFGNTKYIELSGEAAEGILFPCGRLLVVDSLADDHPQKKLLAEYKKAYEARYKEQVSTFGGHAYDAILILSAAIEKAGADKAKARDAIESITGLVGTAGTFNFSAEDHNGLSIDSFEMLTVKDGRFVVAE